MNQLKAPISLNWIVPHHTYAMSLTMSHLCCQLSTHHSKNATLSVSPGAWHVYQDISWYLCTVLDYESSMLPSFNTPQEQCHCVCFLWGIACAQDISQCMMELIHDHCDCVTGTANDVVIHGMDDEEHERCLHKLMKWLVNTAMCSVFENVQATICHLLGCVYNKDGEQPDPS